jgi:hypothetical protein
LSHVAIIDFDHRGSNLIDDRKRLYQASSVIEKWHIIGYSYENKAEYAYSECAEWITWGRIEPPAIIANFWIGRLREHLQTHYSLAKTLSIDEFGKAVNSTHYKRILTSSQLPMDAHRGIDIGRFLAFAGFPRLYLEKAALAMAKAWCFLKKCDRMRKTDSEIGVDPYLESVLIGFSLYDSPADRGPFRSLPGRLLMEHNFKSHAQNSVFRLDTDVSESISRLEIALTIDENDSTDGSDDFEVVENDGVGLKPCVSLFEGDVWTKA